MEQYSNKNFVVPFYTQEEIESREDLTFPFSDKYMIYNKYKHQYFLTEEALVENNIELDENEPISRKLFIEEVSRAIYSYIKVRAGISNYAKMMYRIAKGYGAPNLSSLDFRKIFLEDILLIEARDMAIGGYAKNMPKMVLNPETGRVKASDLSNIDGYWLHDDVITNLDMLNLTNCQRIKWGNQINWDEY